MSSRKRKKYSETFRRQAVDLVAKGRSVAQVAEELGVSAFSVHRWRKALGHVPGSGGQTPLEAEVQAVRRELSQVKPEREILKKSIALFVWASS